jgi:hypothetical protein
VRKTARQNRSSRFTDQSPVTDEPSIGVFDGPSYKKT